jgi:ankyrin repeat protein
MRPLDRYPGNFLGCSGLTEAVEYCCRNGRLEVLTCLLGGSIIDETALAPFLGHSVYTAIENHHNKLIDVLLRAGADVNAGLHKGHDYGTPLLLAIRRKSPELVRKLLDAGANPNNGVLVTAIEEEAGPVIEAVLQARADINAPGESKYIWGSLPIYDRRCTPLTMAILKQRWTLVDQLLDAGSAVNNPPDMRWCVSPLSAAARCKNTMLFRSLLEAGARADDEFTLEEATDDIELLKLVVAELGTRSRWEIPSNAGRRALDKAIKQQNMATVRLILESKLVNVNALLDVNDLLRCSTPLHEALLSKLGHRPKLTQLLLRSGADPNGIVYEPYETSGRRSALLDAIDTKDLQSVQLLLEAGADVNGRFGAEVPFSPVQFAAHMGRVDILRMLLENGSNPNAVSRYGESGAAIQLATEGKRPDMVRMLLKHNANPDAITGNLTHTALQMAARDGCKETVELLLEYGADVNSPPAEKYGATALQFAAIGGYLGIAHILLQTGADVNAPPAKIDGRTALEGAAEHGWSSCLPTLEQTSLKLGRGSMNAL